MNSSSSPQMSVVIVTPDNYKTIRKTMRSLRAQTAREQLEIVIVAPSADDLDLDESDLKDLPEFSVVEVGAVTSTAAARVAGIRQASAPVVAFVEDHSFPDLGWAAALIEAHQQPYAVVGPVIANANPGSTISWANLLIEYAPWLEPVEGGEVNLLPGHNSSYKRAILLEYGDELEAMFEAESILQWDLQAKGYQLYLEPAAKTYHLNFSSPFSWLSLRFHCGRLFAASRAENGQWSPLQRLLYTGSAPLIPLVRLRRILATLRRSGQQYKLLPRVLSALTLGLVLDGMGEMIGYSFGAGNAMEKLSDMEFHRDRHLAERDRQAEAGTVSG